MPAPPLHPREILARLSSNGVEFVLIGGWAVVAHGHIYTTQDLDVVVPMNAENIRKILTALDGIDPRQRMQPSRPRLPSTLGQPPFPKHFYVETTLGWIDFLGDVEGAGSFEEIAARGITLHLAGHDCRVIGLDDLIAAKRTAGRPKDLAVIPPLLALRELRDNP